MNLTALRCRHLSFPLFLDKKWSKNQDFRKVLCNSTVHFLLADKAAACCSNVIPDGRRYACLAQGQRAKCTLNC